MLLVDLPPAELIERLKEGKVYLPENAKRAADSFFRLGNLTALRELALRRTADRVDDQMVDYLKQNAIEGPWQTAERLLVCIGAGPPVRKGGAHGQPPGLGPECALAGRVDRARRQPAAESRDRRSGSTATFELAEQLGAETRRVTGRRFRRGDPADSRGASMSRRSSSADAAQRFPASLLRKSLPDALIERVAGARRPCRHRRGARPPPPPGAALARPVRLHRPRLGARLARWSRSRSRRCSGVASSASSTCPTCRCSICWPCSLSAVYAGYVAALLAAILSALAYNFFFIEPVHTFTIASPHEVFGLFIFLVAALIAGGLASRLRDQAATRRPPRRVDAGAL